MIASGNQNQLQSSLAPLGDLLKALMFLSNLNGFNSSPSLSIQGYNQRKGSSRVWKEKGSKWFYHFPLYLLVFVCISYVFCFTFWVSLVLYFTLFNTFLFGCFSVLFILFFNNFFFEKSSKNTKTVYVMCTLVHMYLGWPLKQSFLNFVSLVA